MNNAQIFQSQANAFVQSNTHMIPPNLKGKPGIFVFIQVQDPSKTGFRWITRADLETFAKGQDDPMQHHLEGMLKEVRRARFSREYCVGVLSCDLELMSILAVEHTRPKGFKRTLKTHIKKS